MAIHSERSAPPSFSQRDIPFTNSSVLVRIGCKSLFRLLDDRIEVFLERFHNPQKAVHRMRFLGYLDVVLIVHQRVVQNDVSNGQRPGMLDVNPGPKDQLDAT